MTSSNGTSALDWRSLSAYGAAKLGPGLIMFAAVPIWSRLFGSHQYGLYSIIWAAALFSSSIFTGWIRQALLRHTGDNQLSLNRLPRWSTILCITMSVVPVVLTTGFQVLSNGFDGSQLLIVVSAAFALLNSIYVILQAQGQRDQEAGRYTLAELLRIACALGLSIAIWMYFPMAGSVAIIISYTVGTVLGIVVLTSNRSVSVPTGVRTNRTLQVFWKYGWPMAIWLTVSSLLLYVDRIIIGIQLGAEQAGLYSAVSDLVVRGFAMIAFPLTMASHPAIMRRWNSGDEVGALDLNRTYQKYLLVVSGIVALIGALIGTFALETVLGVSIGNPFVVPSLVVGGGLWQLALMTHKPLEMANRTKIMVLVIVAITVACAATNVLLIPIFGIVAPAVVFCGGALAYVVTTTFISNRVRKDLLRSVLEPAK